MTEEPTGSPALNIASEAAGIASSFGASASPEGVGTPSAGNSSATPTEESGQAGAPPEGMNITQAEWDALPKAWKKELEPHWKGLPEPVRKYAHEREAQVHRGIQTYRGGYENWQRAVAPFQEILAANPGVDIVGLFTTLAQNHLALSQADPAQKRTLAKQLMTHYGIDMAEANAAIAASGAPTTNGAAAPATGPNGEPFSPAQISWLRQSLGPIFSKIDQTSSHVQKQLQASSQAEVDKFFSNPDNEFADEVAADMHSLLAARKAETLDEAYELAVMRNPQVKAKYIAKLAQRSAPGTSSGPTLPNAKSSNTPPSPGKPASMDDTMQAVVKKHYQ